jgi:hypothetical protein
MFLQLDSENISLLNGLNMFKGEPYPTVFSFDWSSCK